MPKNYISESERGQNLIEFALLTPVVLLFIAAIVMFGLALNARSSVQQAVREGARQASVGATLAEVQTLAAGNADDHIDPADVQWCHPLGSGSPATRGKVGDPVEVYIFKGGDYGLPFELVPANGIFQAFGVSALTVRMSPRAIGRLEKSVPAAQIDASC